MLQSIVYFLYISLYLEIVKSKLIYNQNLDNHKIFNYKNVYVIKIHIIYSLDNVI